MRGREEGGEKKGGKVKMRGRVGGWRVRRRERRGIEGRREGGREERMEERGSGKEK